MPGHRKPLPVLWINGGTLAQISTDFVFKTQGTPYQPRQALNPLGNLRRQQSCWRGGPNHLGTGGRGLILRTSWVIGPVGKNFALNMLRLHRGRDQLSVVADQVGCPIAPSACSSLLANPSDRRGSPVASRHALE